MIKDDDRIEFIFEKIIQEPTEEDSGTSVELFVKFEQDGHFGPTVGFTEELEPSKRSKAEWTYLPLSFVKEVAEYLYSKGAIENLSGSKSKSESSLPSPVVAKPKVSSGSLGLPNVHSGSPVPAQQNHDEQNRPAPPMHGPPIVSSGPQVTMNNNAIEIQNSQPPYQQPLNNMQMMSGPDGHVEASQGFNPFGGQAPASTPNYQVPLQSFAHAAQTQAPQQTQVPQIHSHPGANSNWDLPPQQPQQQLSHSDPNDLTAMLNSDVQETPAHLKGQAAQMLQQRASALNKQINGSDNQKIKPTGQVREEPIYNNING